jgi:hypothetical protein
MNRRAYLWMATIVVVATCMPNALATTYYVSPTGSATWTSCASGTPLSGTSACSRATALQHASGGDTVYFRGGTYSLSGDGSDIGNEGFYPTNSGSSGSAITFMAYPGETPIISGVGAAQWRNTYGFMFYGKSHIRVSGFVFQNVFTYGLIRQSSNHIEIDHNNFTSDAGYQTGYGIEMSGVSACDTYNCWVTHNWIHDNTLGLKYASDGPCTEQVDMLRIGSGYGAGNTVENDNYNTVENNVFYSASHTLLDNYGMFNVIRNNIFHNEPWIPGCTVYQSAASNSSIAIPASTGSNVALTTQPGLGWEIGAGAVIGLQYTGDYSQAIAGYVASYDGSTGALTVGVLAVSGSGTYNSWNLAYGHQVPFFGTGSAYNWLYGHRNVQLTDDYDRDSTHVLFEGNRDGYASPNPNNGAGAGLDLAAPKNIIRYNAFYGSMGTGIYIKYPNSDYLPCNGANPGSYSLCGGQLNRVYGNTIYHNGYGYNWSLYGDANMDYTNFGITQRDAGHVGTGNIFVNNILYQNNGGDICSGILQTPCNSNPSMDFIGTNYYTTNGDPMFTNPSLTNPTSITLPDLTLQSSSPAIDAGTYLTQTSGAGSNSKMLTVNDALFFQDGSWGSELARNVTFFPDWIAVGTVDNVARIAAIDYATNTITLASPLTWSDRASIWLSRDSSGRRVLYGSAPDIGAYEYSGDTSNTSAILGDVNHDGIVNIIDLTLVASNLSGSNAQCDLNTDGLVNLFDVMIVVRTWGRTS